jgi:hypothetical protein
MSNYAVANSADKNLENTKPADMNSCQDVKVKPLMNNYLAKTVVSNNFQLLGTAKFSLLFWDIYQSRLLTSDGQLPLSHNCQHSMFEIQYLRDISKQELLDNTISQWQHLAIDEDEYKPFLVMLENIWPDINSGDKLTLLNNSEITVFYLNQKKIGEIKSEEFADLFLRIWLDENTSEPKLRQQLLGDLI